MRHRLIGKGTTDENGIAHMTKKTSDGGATWSDASGYTGVGAGEVDVIASLDNPVTSGSVQSEPYTLWDTIVGFTGTTDTGNWEGDSGLTLTYDENGTHATGGGLFRLKVGTNTHYFDGTKDLVIEFDFKTDNPCTWYVVNNSGGRGTAIHAFSSALTDFKHIKWIYDATAHTFTPYLDGTAGTAVDVSSQTLTTLGFQITDWQSDLSVHIKNFMVYYG